MSSSEKSKYSPWNTWEDEMWKKSALRALVPFLDLQTEEAAGLERDERRLHLNDDGVIEVAEEPAGELATPAVDEERASAAADVPEAGEAEVRSPTPVSTSDEPAWVVDPATGEVVDPAFVAMTDAQSKALHALLKRKLGATGDDRHVALTSLLERPVTSASQVSKDDASRLIDLLNEEEDHVPEGGE
jgi:hypothetical protein